MKANDPGRQDPMRELERVRDALEECLDNA